VLVQAAETDLDLDGQVVTVTLTFGIDGDLRITKSMLSSDSPLPAGIAAGRGREAPGSCQTTDMTVQLKTTSDGERACRILQEYANEAGNARSGDMYGRYITWTENAERMLGNDFEPETVDELIHTTRYWTLRTSPDMHRLPALVDAELASRQTVLEAAEQTLRRERDRWRARPATLVVVDTNIFLEPGRSILDTDWLTLMNSRPGVRLVVPLIVIHELDRLKRQGNSTTARLAREAIRWLATTLPASSTGTSLLLSGEDHRGVTIEVAVQDGPARPDDADGVIIRFAQQLRLVSGMVTKLVTRDLGMQLRAQLLDVDAVLLETITNGEPTDRLIRG
jgi:hypothetical protein